MKVTVTEGSDIDDVIKAARVKKEFDAPCGGVTVSFRGTVLRPDARVSEYETSDDTPFLLEILEPEGKASCTTSTSSHVVDYCCTCC